MDTCPGALGVCPSSGCLLQGRECSPWYRRLDIQPGGLGISWGRWILAREVNFCQSRALLQVVEDGYEFFAKRQLVTLFSAPNYCGEFDNAGAMMSVDETLMCSFQVSPGRGNTPSSCREGCREFCPPGEWRAGAGAH